MSVLRVGLLLDSERVPQWVAGLLNELQTDERFQLCAVIINRSSETKGASSSFLYRVLRYIDQRLFRLGRDPFQRVSLTLSEDIPRIYVQPLQTRFSDRFPEASIDEIAACKPDLLLRFGFRILRGSILSLTPFGVWSLHHGDTANYRGGPPAFWEVVRKEPVTAVTLQILTEKLDAGVILDKCFLRTDITSFWRNQQKLYWAGQKLFLESLRRAAFQGVRPFIDQACQRWKGEKLGTLYKNPGNARSFMIAIDFFRTTLLRRIHDLLFIDQWQLFYTFSSGKGSIPSNNFRSEIKPPKDRIWADPFLVQNDDRYFLFCEEKMNHSSQAHIICFSLDQQGEMIESKPKKVLQEDFHLSYPFIFQENSKFYMLPEAAASGKVTLYEAQDFPFQWKPVRQLLTGMMAYDPTLYLHDDGLWYLFCTVKPNADHSSNAYLHIYYSRDLLNGSFEPHPLNPIYKDVRCARPAGKLFREEGKLIRPIQVSAPVYGYATVFNEVTTLSPTSFNEHPVYTRKPWRKKMIATHTYNSLGNACVVDAQISTFKWF